MLHHLFEDSPSTKVLDFISQPPKFDFSKSIIKRECKISWKKTDEIIDNLERLKVILPTRTIGRAKMFKTNTGSKIYLSILSLDLQLMKVVNHKDDVENCHECHLPLSIHQKDGFCPEIKTR